MTLNEAKAVIYGNVVYACEKAGFPPATTQLVQDACDTIIALANACETIITLADRKTEPTCSKMEQVDKDINVRSKDEPQTDVYDYKGNGKWERSE